MKSPLCIHVLLLAAGESKRFKGIKQLAVLEQINADNKNFHADKLPKQQLLIVRAIEQIKLSGFQSSVVLLGANATHIKAALLENNASQKNTQYEVFDNWYKGMGATIANGMKNVPEQATHVCITLADQAALTHAHYDLLISHVTEHPKHIVSAVFNDRVGAPSIFPARYFSQLARLTGDKGARQLISDESENVIGVSIPQAALDIDTSDDLINFNEQR